jgi:hypothetical protein
MTQAGRLSNPYHPHKAKLDVLLLTAHKQMSSIVFVHTVMLQLSVLGPENSRLMQLQSITRVLYRV